MPIKRTRQTHTTGDIARAVGCDDLTVRRWLEAHQAWLKEREYRRQEGVQYQFETALFCEIVDRISEAHIRFPHHVNRFEKRYGDRNQKIPF